MVSVMTQYSLLDRRPEQETLNLLQQKNIGVVIRGSVAQGLLVNKPPKPYLNYSEEEISKTAQTVHSLSNNQRSPAQTAIQFVLNHAAATSAIVGMRTMEQLEEAVAAIDVSPLSETEMRTLQNALPANYYKEHL